MVAPPAPANETAGPAETPRWGGAVRQSEPAANSTTGAARLGQSAPLGVSGAAQPLPLPAPAPAISPAPSTADAVLAAAPLSTPTPPVAEAVAPVAAPDRALESRLAAPSLSAPTQRHAETLPTPITPPAPTPQPAPEPPAERRLQAPATALRAPQPALSPNPASAVALTPETGQLPRTDAPVGRPGSPDAGAQVGRDVATPAAAAASAVPRLNLELSRPRGGELSRHGTAGVLPLLPRPPERDEKLARDIEKAARRDCRTAHSGAGILAVIPLVVDALKKDGGCKW